MFNNFAARQTMRDGICSSKDFEFFFPIPSYRPTSRFEVNTTDQKYESA